MSGRPTARPNTPSHLTVPGTPSVSSIASTPGRRKLQKRRTAASLHTVATSSAISPVANPPSPLLAHPSAPTPRRYVSTFPPAPPPLTSPSPSTPRRYVSAFPPTPLSDTDDDGTDSAAPSRPLGGGGEASEIRAILSTRAWADETIRAIERVAPPAIEGEDVERSLRSRTDSVGTQARVRRAKRVRGLVRGDRWWVRVKGLFRGNGRDAKMGKIAGSGGLAP